MIFFANLRFAAWLSAPYFAGTKILNLQQLTDAYDKNRDNKANV